MGTYIGSAYLDYNKELQRTNYEHLNQIEYTFTLPDDLVWQDSFLLRLTGDDPPHVRGGYDLIDFWESYDGSKDTSADVYVNEQFVGHMDLQRFGKHNYFKIPSHVIKTNGPNQITLHLKSSTFLENDHKSYQAELLHLVRQEHRVNTPRPPSDPDSEMRARIEHYFQTRDW